LLAGSQNLSDTQLPGAMLSPDTINGAPGSSMPSSIPKPKATKPKARGPCPGKYCRRGAEGVPRTCQVCHQLKERHYAIINGERKFILTGVGNCPRQACVGVAGQGMCDKQKCLCFADNPDAVSDWLSKRST
jgi:hypothetical protein